MKKLRITESQRKMLETKVSAKLKEDIAYSNSGSKKVSDNFKRAGANKIEGLKLENEIEDKVEWGEIAPKVLDLIKQLYTNPSKDNLDPFWESVGLDWDEMIQMLTAVGIIKSVSGGYRLVNSSGNASKTVKIVGKLLEKMINDKTAPIEEDNYPAGAQDDPRAPYNQTEPNKGKQSQQQILDLKVLVDNLALFGKDGNLYAYDVESADSEEYSQYASRDETPLGRDEDGDMNVEYGEWEMDEEIVSNYINDNLSQLSVGKGLNDWENGIDLVQVDQELAIDLLELTEFIKNPRLAKSFVQTIKQYFNNNESKLEEDGGYPAGAQDDPRAPYNQTEPNKGKQSQNLFDLVLYTDDEAYFTKDGKLYVYNIESADSEEYSQYASRDETPLGRDEDGDMNIEYGEWEMDGDIVNSYVNDNLPHLSVGRGLDDYENGVDLVQVNQELARDLIDSSQYIRNPKVAQELIQLLKNINIEETTSAGGGASGSYVGSFSAGSNNPINKSNVSSEMGDIIETEGEPILSKLDSLLNNGLITPQQWLASEAKIKNIVDELQNDNNLKVVVPHIVHMLQLAEKGMDADFGILRDKVLRFVNKQTPMANEATTVSSAGGDSGSFAYDAPAGDGGNFWTAGNKMAKKGPANESFHDINGKHRPIKEIKSREGKDAKTETQWPDGKFVEFDDCTKLNNNKKAQNGGCSTGAVDNVVKTKGSKNSVISDASIYESIAKKTGRTIADVKHILLTKNNSK